MIFLLMALVVLFFVVMQSADIHRILSVKDRSQNAGDAATLEAARWQASSLNLMGELNIVHALALAVDDDATVDAATNTQARLCFTGPMTAFSGAQQAAKLNGLPVQKEFTEFVRERARVVRHEYGARIGGRLALQEPYDGAWDEYASMLEAVAEQGVAAGADNASFFNDAGGSHTLYDPGFYDAVAGRTWCWFHHHEPHLLEDYTTFAWWPALPAIPQRWNGNAEIFSLRMGVSRRPLRSLVTMEGLQASAEENGRVWTGDASNRWRRVDQTWYVYDAQDWGRWDALDDPFPVEGHVRREYDYEGADAVVRVQTAIERFTPGAGGAGSTDGIVWTAAGKPFGYLTTEGDKDVPNLYGLVLPAFRDVRLMPVDAATGGGGGSFNLAWRRHITEHLPVYMKWGPGGVSAGCWYCRQLYTWEIPEFRQAGVKWLDKNSKKCTVTPGGHGGSHGGSHHAH